MSFSTPWTPLLNGNNLPVFEALAEVQSEGLVPDQKMHLSWARKTVEEALGDVSEGREAIWESVLELWRLKYLEDLLESPTEGFARLWQQYASSWLVSGMNRDGVATEMLI